MRSLLVILAVSLSSSLQRGVAASSPPDARILPKNRYDTSKLPRWMKQDENNRYRRHLDDEEEDDNSLSQCYSTDSSRGDDRYCVFENTPRDDTFLLLSCPDSKDDLSRCHCTIGVGDPDDAPDNDTCLKCGFCSDGTLAYDCRNVAEGTCIGRNCRGDCVSSLAEPTDVFLEGRSNALRRKPFLFVGFVGVTLAMTLHLQLWS